MGSSVRFGILGLLCAGALGGCRSTPAPDTVPEIYVRTAKLLDPDSRGNSADLRVKVFQLKDDARFLAAGAGRDGLKKLWSSPRETLGSELLGEPQLITLEPNRPVDRSETQPITIRDPQDGVRFVGIIGDFRELVQDTWRVCAKAGEVKDSIFEFQKFSVVQLKRARR